MAQPDLTDYRLKLTKWMDSFAHKSRFDADNVLSTDDVVIAKYSRAKVADIAARKLREYRSYAGDKVIGYAEFRSLAKRLKELLIITWEPRVRLRADMARVYPISIFGLKTKTMARFEDKILYFSEHALCRIIQRENCQSLSDVNTVIEKILMDVWERRTDNWAPGIPMALLTDSFFMPLAPRRGDAPIVKTYVPRRLWRPDQEEAFEGFLANIEDDDYHCRFMPNPPSSLMQE